MHAKGIPITGSMECLNTTLLTVLSHQYSVSTAFKQIDRNFLGSAVQQKRMCTLG